MLIAQYEIMKERDIHQDALNQQEWENDSNWTFGSDYLTVYFSQKDTRSVVPKKLPWMGWTFNLAKPGGVNRLVSSIFLVPLIIVVLHVIIMFFYRG